MEQGDVRRVEHKFDRSLSEGEAAEILNEEIIHHDDDVMYEDSDEAWAPLAVSHWRRNGR